MHACMYVCSMCMRAECIYVHTHRNHAHVDFILTCIYMCVCDRRYTTISLNVIYTYIYMYIHTHTYAPTLTHLGTSLWMVADASGTQVIKLFFKLIVTLERRELKASAYTTTMLLPLRSLMYVCMCMFVYVCVCMRG